MNFAPLLASFVLLCAATSASNYDDYDSDEDETVLEPCDRNRCRPPNCTCFGTSPPGGLAVKDVPQFVMLTFDDAITVDNVQTYRKILDDQRRVNDGNKCPITMTFFVCHEYNDYELTNELYAGGNEIAVHSITHETNTDLWKTSPLKRWENEMVGMRTILSKFGGIPESTISGHRAPFLQTAGNVTFQMLRDNHFLYDSSMPTLNYMKPPIWPYTLDHGYVQDCQIRPCPTGAFPGLWIVPMVQYRRQATSSDGKTTVFYCSMADACTPYPETPEDTKRYLMENFERHYNNNRAPFPLFLHQAWLRNEDRLQGYLQFIDEIRRKDDVFFVTIREVIHYMQRPVTLESYRKQGCFSKSKPRAGDCSEPRTCHYPRFRRGIRFMKSCVPCSKRYPWLGNPEGRK